MLLVVYLLVLLQGLHTGLSNNGQYLSSNSNATLALFCSWLTCINEVNLCQIILLMQIK